MNDHIPDQAVALIRKHLMLPMTRYPHNESDFTDTVTLLEDICEHDFGVELRSAGIMIDPPTKCIVLHLEMFATSERVHKIAIAGAALGIALQSPALIIDSDPSIVGYHLPDHMPLD